MSEKLFDPNEPIIDRRPVERVELEGGVVYVKGMEAADVLFCQEHSTRAPGGPAHLALDFSAMQIWQIVVSCYKGKEPDAPRMFDVSHTQRIKKLSRADWIKLREAIDTVNGVSEEAASEMRDFTAAGPDDSPEMKPSSVCATSAGFPANSPSPIPA